MELKQSFRFSQLKSQAYNHTFRNKFHIHTYGLGQRLIYELFDVGELVES